MALGACRECGGQVSDSAKFCPHCGSPSQAEALKGTGQAIGTIGCLLTLFVTVPILIIVIWALMG